MAPLYGALGILIIIGLPAYFAGRVARRKNRPFWVYFVAGLIVGPLVLLAALLLPGRRRFA